MIISCSKKVTDSLTPVASIETGQMVEVSSIMMLKLSLSGLMKKIN